MTSPHSQTGGQPGAHGTVKGLPGTEPFMDLKGDWYWIGGPCRHCGHALLWHTIATNWKCQEQECQCSPEPTAP